MPTFQDALNNAAFESLSSDPSAPTGGAQRFYYNTTTDTVRVYDGTQWIDVGSSGGSGEINYITNPSAKSSIDGWVASGAGVTATRTTTLADVPRETLSPYGIKITCVSGTSDYVRFRFQIGDADKGKKLKIQWAQKALSGYAAGDLVLKMYTNSASDYSGSYTQLQVESSSIPASDFVLLTTFDSSTADYYELRIQIAAGTAAIVLSDVVVGPGTLSSVPALYSGVSFTGGGSWVSNTTYSASYDRIGRFAKVNYKLSFTGAPTATTLTLNAPPGLTLDTSVAGYNTSTNYAQNFGEGFAYSSGSSVPALISMGYASSAWTPIYYTTAGASGNPVVLQNFITETAPHAWGTGDFLTISWIFPVAEWASDGVYSAQTAVQYLSNSAMGDSASSAATTVVGQNGSLLASGALTASRTRLITPVRTPLPTDRLILEISPGNTPDDWTDVSTTTLRYDEQNTATYGIIAQRTGVNEITVTQGQYAVPNGATFGSAGRTWADFTSYRYRLIIASNPLTIGHNLVTQTNSGLVSSSGQLSGTNTNDDAATGNVGEVFSSIVTTPANAAATTVWGDITSVPLTPGDWDCMGSAVQVLNGATSTVTKGAISTNSGNTTTDHQEGYNEFWELAATSTVKRACQIPTYRVKVATGTTQTVYLKGNATYSAGTPQYIGTLICRRRR